MKACPNVDYFDALLLVRELQPRRPASMLPQCQRLGNLFILIFFFLKETQNKKVRTRRCAPIECQFSIRNTRTFAHRSIVNLSLFFFLCFFFLFLRSRFSFFTAADEWLLFARAYIDNYIGWLSSVAASVLGTFDVRGQNEFESSWQKIQPEPRIRARWCRGHAHVLHSMRLHTHSRGWPMVRCEPITIGKPLTNDVTQPILRARCAVYSLIRIHIRILTPTPNDARAFPTDAFFRMRAALGIV